MSKKIHWEEAAIRCIINTSFFFRRCIGRSFAENKLKTHGFWIFYFLRPKNVFAGFKHSALNLRRRWHIVCRMRYCNSFPPRLDDFFPDDSFPENLALKASKCLVSYSYFVQKFRYKQSLSLEWFLFLQTLLKANSAYVFIIFSRPEYVNALCASWQRSAKSQIVLVGMFWSFPKLLWQKGNWPWRKLPMS